MKIFKRENWHFHRNYAMKNYRHWLRYNPDPNKWRERFLFQLEVSTRRQGPMISLSLGDRGSETPVDIILGFFFVTFYVGLDWRGLGELCEKIGRGHKRELSLKVFDGDLWWRLWYNDAGGYDVYHKCDKWAKPKVWPWSAGPRKYRRWMCLREGSIDLNPIDTLWGSRKFVYEDVEKKTKTLKMDQFPGDRYEVDFTLQRVYRKREHGPSWIQKKRFSHWAVAWNCEKGIPHQNHDWKGDNVYASAERIDNPLNWWVKANVSLRKRIERDRVKYNYRPPMPDLLSIPQKQALAYVEYDVVEDFVPDPKYWTEQNKKED